MAYTKTQWVNGVTPVNQTNMNKIEDELEALDTGKVDVVSGKGLSTNDYTNEDKAKVDSAYQKANTGIPKTDLASDVQTSLGKADSAIQSHQSLAAYRTSAAQDTIDSGKMSNPSNTGTVGQVLKKTLTGSQWETMTIDTDYLEQAKAIVSQWKPMVFELPQNATTYDIICFAGQSNMCGRATLENFQNPEDVMLSIPQTKAFTYQASSSGTTVGSTALAITEPISVNGSSGYGLVPAFLNAYYYASGRKAVCCFKSVGGEKIDKFLPYTINRTTGEITQTPTAYYASMSGFINDTKTKLQADGKTVGKILLVWCQGEADAEYLGTDSAYCSPYEKTLTTTAQKIAYYNEKFEEIVDELVDDCALDHAFIIRIGHLHATGNIKYESIIEAHNKLGKEYDKCTVVSTFFAGAKVYKENDGTIRDLMRDSWHYKPEGYVRAGYEAGINAAHVVTSSFQCKPILVEWNQVYLDSINETMSYGKDRKVDKYIYSPQRFDMEYAKKLASDKVTSMTVSPSSMSLEVGQTVQLTPTIYPETATEQGVTYLSSDTSILTVSNTGLVTAVAVGTATITLTSVDSPTVTTTFTGTVSASVIAVSSVTLNKSTASMLTDDTLQLTATVLPDNATNKAVTWTTSDSSTAMVDNTGLVTALREGSITIRAAAVSDSTKYAECAISITQQVITTTHVDVDFTDGDTVATMVDDGLVSIPTGSDTTMLSYDSTNGMTITTGALPYGLKLEDTIQVPHLWCMEFEMKMDSSIDDNLSANWTMISGTDATQRPHTHALTCIAPTVFLNYNAGRHSVAVRCQEDVSTANMINNVFLCDGNFHTYKIQMVASYVMEAYRDGVKIDQKSCLSNVGYWGYLFGVHQGYNYASQFCLKTGMYLKNFKLTSTSSV